ncbi:DNA-directed RNA polymerase subunit omega [Sporosarcina sp. Te-1]|uniref:DNA-directed RNA polymerase subunit omega n=1 Tax=Sporosarcina sp. Te-1 TaxID=2818390 RepID=UPI001A9DDD7E|nr:DNA-directed RNA polymerase subunit omega [Sporosarcina sp. Te-1]QTD42375.1 DNA-directed RNA polymerase subunit omega [Sporosarcina sp. Te-1]
MLYPSVDSLKEKIDSKYTLVTLAAKRAREMQETREVLLGSYRSQKNVGKALEEVAAGVLSTQAQDDSIVYEDEV